MDWKLMMSTFVLVFLAELGDKTQLATFCLSANNQSRMSVFLGASGALVLTSIVAVLLGVGCSELIPQHYLKIGSGLLFIVFGVLIISST